MKFFHTEWCPECALVQSRLDELAIDYENEIVPDVRPFRKQVYEVSGQYYVPVLVDGEKILTETSEILAYLDHYASGVKAGEEMPLTSAHSEERNP